MNAPDPESYVAAGREAPAREAEPAALKARPASLAPAPQGGAIVRGTHGDSPRPSAEASRPAVSVRRQVLTLAWPAVLEQMLFALVGLVDAFIVGHLGPNAMTGVGLGGQVTFLAFAMMQGLGVGSTALIARHVGAREPDEANRFAWQSLLAAIIVGVAVALFALAFAEPAIAFFDSTPEVVRLGAIWLRVFALSLPLLAVLSIGNAAMRGAGNTRTPLTVMIIVNVLNTGIGLFLVRGLGVGVVGTAIGTTTGQVVGGLIVFALLWRGHAGMRLADCIGGLDWARIRRIVNVGLPAGIEQLLLQLALMGLNFIITGQLLVWLAQIGISVAGTGVGEAAYAAHIITWRISGMAYLPGFGFAVAATTLVGQELGRKDPRRATRSGYEAFGLALAVMAVIGVPLFFFAGPLAATMTDDPDVLRMADLTLRIAALSQLPLAGSFVFSGALRGAGDTRTTLAISVACIWLVRLTVALGLGVGLGLGLTGVWWAICADFGMRALIFGWRFHRGKWQTIRV